MAAPYVTGLVALYIAANGRATNYSGVFKIRQAIVDNSLPQSQWRTNNTGDPDSNPEPLAMASLNWLTSTNLPITLQPASQIICSGNNAIFSVITIGGNFTYQWLLNDTNLSDNIRISGSLSNTLSITNLGFGDAGNYRVIVTDEFGTNTISAAAVLTVLPPNMIQDGSFEIPAAIFDEFDNFIGPTPTFQTGDTFGGAWLVESTSSGVFLNYYSAIGIRFESNWRPTPAGARYVMITEQSPSVIRQDMATTFYAGTNYSISFLQCGYLDFHAPAQVTFSIAPTGSTNPVFAQSFSVLSYADWTRQRSNFSVPTNGLYSLRIASTPGYVAFVDDVSIAAAPVAVAPAPPVFQSISQSGNLIVLTWSAVAGQNHQLQYKTNLTDTNWINTGTNITATNATISASDTNASDPQRFYRVLVSP